MKASKAANKDLISHILLQSGDVAVYVGNSRAGTITRAGDGFAYVPAGRSKEDHGEIYSTVALCLRSLY